MGGVGVRLRLGSGFQLKLNQNRLSLNNILQNIDKPIEHRLRVGLGSNRCNLIFGCAGRGCPSFSEFCRAQPSLISYIISMEK